MFYKLRSPSWAGHVLRLMASFIYLNKDHREVRGRTRNIFQQFGFLSEYLAAVSAIHGIEVLPLTPSVAVAAAYLRETHGLSFFDSHYAATALTRDGIIYSFDSAYDKVSGLTRMDPSHT